MGGAMFNITSDALQWLSERLKPRWFWATLAFIAVLFSVWNSVPEKYQTVLIDYAVDQTSDKSQDVDIVISDFILEDQKDEFSVWLKNKIERNLVELFVDHGKKTAHRLTVIQASNKPHKKLEGTISEGEEGQLEISARLVNPKGAVIASTNFSATPEFLKDNYKTLPETLIYGMDIGAKSLSPLNTQARVTKSLKAYALYLQARRYAHRQKFQKAIGFLDQALLEDQNFATAYWASSKLFDKIGDKTKSEEQLSKANSITIDYPKLPILKNKTNPLPAIMQKLSNAKWKSVSQNFDWKSLNVKEYGVLINAWRFEPADYKIQVALQKKATGSSVKNLRKEKSAILAINGGFFDLDENSRLSPSGFLVTNNKKISDYRKKAGSALLYDKDGQIEITWSKEAESLSGLSQALQAGPMVVDPGGKNGIYKNDYNRHNRTAICITKNKKILFLVVTGGASLYELGAILSSSESDGGFGCERAMNLDGGPSTQASFLDPKSKKLHEIHGTWTSQNAVLVFPKK